MTFRDRLKKRDLLLGTWFVSPTFALADVICQSDLDFIIIDREHGQHSFESVMNCAIVAKANAVHSIVRCSDILQPEILRCLDTGVDGLQVPNVTTASQVSKVLDYALYPPEGNRGYSIFTRSGRYGALPATDYPKKANTDSAVIINLESVEAADNIEAFIAHDRIDCFFIGLFDLSKSLGTPGDFTSAEFKRCVENITRQCVAAGKSVGTICADVHDAKRYREMGMNYLVYSVDCNVIRRAYQTFVDDLRKLD